MNSIILQTTARGIGPLLLFLSIYLLLAGHDEPGGGFVGGLVAASAFLLHAIAFGVGPARRALRVEPRTVAAAGLVLVLAAAWAGTLRGAPLLTGLWSEAGAGGVVAPGTPVLFDAGVFLIVLGATLSAVFSHAEEED